MALPVFSDTDLWMVHDGTQAFTFDPDDVASVVAALDRNGLPPTAILEGCRALGRPRVDVLRDRENPSR